jgi:hypothetical protein
MPSHPGNQNPAGRSRKRIIWIIGGVLIVVASLIALQGIIRGTGEAVGVDEAAPGGANTTPAGDSSGLNR